MKNDKNKKQETWGHVEPGPLSEGEAAALRPMQENASKCDVKSTNMDPEPAEGESSDHTEDTRKHWQMLDESEKDKTSHRKDGYPKNTGYYQKHEL